MAQNNYGLEISERDMRKLAKDLESLDLLGDKQTRSKVRKDMRRIYKKMNLDINRNLSTYIDGASIAKNMGIRSKFYKKSGTMGIAVTVKKGKEYLHGRKNSPILELLHIFERGTVDRYHKSGHWTGKVINKENVKLEPQQAAFDPNENKAGQDLINMALTLLGRQIRKSKTLTDGTGSA